MKHQEKNNVEIWSILFPVNWWHAALPFHLKPGGNGTSNNLDWHCLSRHSRENGRHGRRPWDILPCITRQEGSPKRLMSLTVYEESPGGGGLLREKRVFLWGKGNSEKKRETKDLWRQRTEWPEKQPLESCSNKKTWTAAASPLQKASQATAEYKKFLEGFRERGLVWFQL